MRYLLTVVIPALLLLAAAALAPARPAHLFGYDTPRVLKIELFDYAEVVAKLDSTYLPPAANPFAVKFAGTLTPEAGGDPVRVTGFCDDPATGLYRIRYLPKAEGEYTLTAEFPEMPGLAKYAGTLTVTPSKLRGLVEVDPKYPHHFRFSGTGEHYFYNGATAYWLLGHADDADIFGAIDRLAAAGITRIRVALNARTTGGDRWFEPKVVNTPKFQFNLMPWVAAAPDHVKSPGIDTSRYNVAFWQKAERMLRHARDKEMQVSLIFHLDGQDPGVDPFGAGKPTPLGEPEANYYRYAAARLAAYSNVMWDITNEWHLFRDEAWVNAAAGVLRAADPYRHLMTVHGKGTFPFRAAEWADYCVYQQWDDSGGYDFLRKNRLESDKLGKPKPQVNEEYGYEGHYPGKWGGGKVPPARDADSRRKLAWQMTFAGGYQTTGERADTGAGGWLTGRGDDSMILPKLHGYLAKFVAEFEWWKCDPADGLSEPGVRVLAEPGEVYAAYLPAGRRLALKLPAGVYTLRRINPGTGEWLPADKVEARAEAVAVEFPAEGDWAALLARVK